MSDGIHDPSFLLASLIPTSLFTQATKSAPKLIHRMSNAPSISTSSYPLSTIHFLCITSIRSEEDQRLEQAN